MALRQAKNKVVIEGILSEISLDEGAYMRDDKKNEFLGGYIKIKTEQKKNQRHGKRFGNSSTYFC